jgi:hypothetical protein
MQKKKKKSSEDLSFHMDQAVSHTHAQTLMKETLEKNIKGFFQLKGLVSPCSKRIHSMILCCCFSYGFVSHTQTFRSPKLAL